MRIPNILIALILAVAACRGGTITLNPANVAALLSGLDSTWHLVVDGKESGIAKDAAAAKACVRHLWHCKAAVKAQKAKSTKAVK